MGRKAKHCGSAGVGTKGGRDEKVAAPAPAEGASSDEEGGTTYTAPALPMANLVRLMRQSIPESVKISSRAKDLTHDCAVEFSGLLIGEACERATAEHRRTIAPEDFMRSFQALGFDDYVKPMSAYMSCYRDREQVNTAAGYRERRVHRRGEGDDGGSTSVQK